MIGGATEFSRSFQTWDNPLLFLILLIISVRFVVTYKVKFNKYFVLLISYFLLYYLLLTLKCNEFHYKFLFIYPLSFFIAYSVIMSLKLRFFIIYENLLKYLCLIALFFWFIQILVPVQLNVLLRSLTILKPFNTLITGHIGVYTIMANEGVKSIFPRNCGFAWEPGAFAVFINMAIFINLIRNKFRLINNINLYIFIATLASTQSTTGYSIFLLLVIFYLLNVKFNSTVILFAPIFVVGFIYFLSLPFMYDKIEALFNEKVSDAVEVGSQEWNSDKNIGAQRFVSFQIDFIDFMNNPILGYGGHDEDMWTKKQKSNITSISGIGKIFAKFGLVGILFFFSTLYKNSIKYSQVFKFKGKFILLLLIIQVSVSYSLVESPLFLCFWMFFYFKPNFIRDDYKGIKVITNKNLILDKELA